MMFLFSKITLIYLLINVESKEITNKITPFFSKAIINKPSNQNNILNKNKINNPLLFLENGDEKNDKRNTSENKYDENNEIFIKYSSISFILLFLGCLSIFYGAYHHKCSLILYLSLSIYYILVIIFVNATIFHTPFIFLFSIISAILIFLSINTNNNKSPKFIIQKILYGGAAGCFLHKIFIFYIIILDNDAIENQKPIYYISFFLFILLSGIINWLSPDFIAFLSGSIISGSFYLILFLDCIIFPIKRENNKKENFITTIIIHIIIIICSTLYQNFYLKYKYTEMPDICESMLSSYNSPRDSNALNTTKSSDEIKIGNNQSMSKIQEESFEEEEINDQED